MRHISNSKETYSDLLTFTQSQQRKQKKKRGNMEIHVKTSDFLKAIQTVEGVVNTKLIKSVLSNLKIEASDSKVFLSSTDMELSLRTSILSNVVKPGSTSLPARQLASIFKTIHFPDSKISVVSDPDNPLTLITDAEGKVETVFQINGMNPEEIKTIGEIPEEDITNITTIILKDMIRKTYYAVATDEVRFVFNGLYFRSQGNLLTVVGTDGRRLARINRSFPSALPFSEGIIIPHKTIREMMKVLEEADLGKTGKIDGQFYIQIGNTEILSKLIEGSFPDYEQVIPKDVKYKTKVNKEEFSIILKQALISAEEPSKQIRFHFQPGKLTVFASNPGTIQFESTMRIDYSGEDLTIAFKGDYIADCIKSIDDLELEIQFSNSTTPVLFKDPSDTDYVAVIMPMKI